jgi:hypothetical protein
LFQQAKDCNHCVIDLQPACPECCLKTAATKKVIRCSPEESAVYNCTAQAFSPAACPDSSCASQNWDKPLAANYICKDAESKEDLNHCQNKGCPERDPYFNIAKDEKCVFANSTWYCNTNGLAPQSTGCAAENNTITSPCPGPYYLTQKINDIEDGFCPESLDYPCYKYRATAGFSQCTENCADFTAAWDTCNNGRECCKRAVCAAKNPAGFANNCNPLSCAEILGITNCDTYTDSRCAELSEKATACLLEGKCTSCFQEIDPAFYYRFVPKSRESLTIIWQMSTSPKPAPAFFYSKIKVFEIRADGSENPQAIHESMVHQKSLEAAFSIFCASRLSAEKLKPGKAYVVRVYYFLALNPKLNLEMKINEIRLIVIKSRE